MKWVKIEKIDQIPPESLIAAGRYLEDGTFEQNGKWFVEDDTYCYLEKYDEESNEMTIFVLMYYPDEKRYVSNYESHWFEDGGNYHWYYAVENEPYDPKQEPEDDCI